MIPLHIAQQLADALRDADNGMDCDFIHRGESIDGVLMTREYMQRIKEALAAFEAAKAQPVRVKLPPTLCVEDYSAIGRTRAAFTGERATVEVLNRALVISALKDQGIEVAE